MWQSSVVIETAGLNPFYASPSFVPGTTTTSDEDDADDLSYNPSSESEESSTNSVCKNDKYKISWIVGTGIMNTVLPEKARQVTRGCI